MIPGVEPGNVAYVTAGVAVRHKAPAADDGYVGIAIKQDTPAADVVRADRDLIAAGKGYLLMIRGIHEIPNAALPGIAKGALVYINTTTNALAAAGGAGLVVLGKVASLPGERGTPADKVKVNLNEKA